MKTISQIELNMLIEKHNRYLMTITDKKKDGDRLILDEIDFTNNDLSNLDFMDIYITDSFFYHKYLKTKIWETQSYIAVFLRTLCLKIVI